MERRGALVPEGGADEAKTGLVEVLSVMEKDISHFHPVRRIYPAGFSVPKSKVLHIIHYPDETLPDSDMKK